MAQKEQVMTAVPKAWYKLDEWILFFTTHRIIVTRFMAWGSAMGGVLGIVGMVIYVFLLFGGIKQSIIYYKHTKNIDYLFWILLLLFCTINGALESAIVLPSMIMFLSIVAFMHLGFIIEPQNKEITLL